MTFLDRINQLQLKAVAANDEDKIKTCTGELTTLHERLSASIVVARQADVGHKELQSAGIRPDDYEQNRASAADLMKALVVTVESLSVQMKFDAAKTQGSAAEALCRKSYKIVADAWRNYLPSVPPTVDDDLLEALQRGGVDVEAIRSDIESAKSVLLMLGNRTIPELGDTVKLEKALGTLASSGKRIGDLIDPAIANVVVRAQDGGVRYSEMTAEVVLALTKLGILDRFRVVLK